MSVLDASKDQGYLVCNYSHPWPHIRWGPKTTWIENAKYCIHCCGTGVKPIPLTEFYGRD